MAANVTSGRLPHGTRVLAKTFLSAADSIPEARRGEVVKAALSLIREELKIAKEKAKYAKMAANTRASDVLPARKTAQANLFNAPPEVSEVAPQKVTRKTSKPLKKEAVQPEAEVEQQAAELSEA